MRGTAGAWRLRRWSQPALIGLSAAPALAQNVPLPAPRPTSIARRRPPARSRGRLIARRAAHPDPRNRNPCLQATHAPVPLRRHAGAQPDLQSLRRPVRTARLHHRAQSRPARHHRQGEQLPVQRAELEGNFVQVGPDGGRTQGEFYISKPGKVRFEYDAPSPIELIADGQSVVVRDRRLATQDSIRCRRRRCASCSPTMST